MSHVQSVDVKVYVVKAADLENISTPKRYQRWMKLTNWDFGKVPPLVLVKVEGVALIVTKRHTSHAHVEHQVRDSTCHDNLIAASNCSVRKFTKRHVRPFYYKTSVLLQLERLIADAPFLDLAATHEEDMVASDALLFASFSTHVG